MHPTLEGPAAGGAEAFVHPTLEGPTEGGTSREEGTRRRWGGGLVPPTLKGTHRGGDPRSGAETFGLGFSLGRRPHAFWRGHRVFPPCGELWRHLLCHPN